MRRWLRSVDWLAINTSALVLILMIWCLSCLGFPDHDHHDTNARYAADTKLTEFPWPASAEGWTAVFTGLLTFSTAGLWIVTRTAANAAKAAAEALPKLERAYVLFTGAVSDDIRESLTLGNLTRTRFALKYNTKNHGRTAAIIKAIRLSAGYVEVGFPKMPDAFGSEWPDAFVMGSGDSPPAGTVTFPIAGSDFEKAKKSIGHIFFWGKIEYLDVFDNPHETGLCAEWSFDEGRFIVSECRELNYHT